MSHRLHPQDQDRFYCVSSIEVAGKQREVFTSQTHTRFQVKGCGLEAFDSCTDGEERDMGRRLGVNSVNTIRLM